MSSWGQFKSGLGWSETQASSVLSERTSTTADQPTAGQTESVSESVGIAKSNSLEVTRTTTELTTQSTSEFLSRAAMDTRSIENAGAEDDALQLLRWEKETQQVDKDQSEIVHQQWRLFREQVATLSSTTISIRSQIKDLYRIAHQEEAERRAAVETVQVALRASEERIFGMLEDLSRNQVSGMAIEKERAERVSTCNKILDELEAEKVARLSAWGELASDFSRLRRILEENLQKSANFMKEQSSIEARARETDFAMQQSVKHLEGQMEACQVGERLLEEKLGHAESAIKTELQTLRNELKHELAERVKGDENRLDILKQGLAQELAERVRAEREDIQLLIEVRSNTLSQDYTILLEKRLSETETLTRTLLQDEAKARAELRKELERETAERIKVDRELSSKKDELDTITRVEVEEHKQRLDRDLLMVHKNIQDHKAQYEEYKEVRELAHSSLQVDMEQMWKSEITQLKFDQDVVLQRLQVDYDTLRRQHEEFVAEVWKDEVRRVWEALDSHTHNVSVTDRQKREEPTRNVIKREIVTQIMPPGYQVERVGRATIPVHTRGMVASNSMKAFASVNNIAAVRAAPRMATPPASPGPPRGSLTQAGPPMTMTPPAPLLSPESSPKVLGVIRTSSVERDLDDPESASPVMRSASTQVASLDTPSSSVAVSPSSGLKRRDGSPTLGTSGFEVILDHKLNSGLASSMGRAIQDIRSNPSSIVTERLEEVITHPGKIHHHVEALVGKANFEHNSELDPEAKRDH